MFDLKLPKRINVLKCSMAISHFNVGKCSAFTYTEPTYIDSGSGRGVSPLLGIRKLPASNPGPDTDFLDFRALVALLNLSMKGGGGIVF
jgi:hypothetical protein